jgi:hypothetical protein
MGSFGCKKNSTQKIWPKLLLIINNTYKFIRNVLCTEWQTGG